MSNVIDFNKAKTEKAYKNYNYNINLAYDDVYKLEREHKRRDIEKKLTLGYMKILSDFNK